jgi:fucose 4-O-acetylase-like acetyltransferase
VKINEFPMGAKPRSSTLDIAKGIGIAFVVLGHNWAVLHEKGEMFRVIFSFHMPLFFFMSGVFMRENTSLIYATNSRFQSLLKPYFVTAILLGLVKIISQSINNQMSIDGLWQYLYGIFYATGRTIEWVTLWFLPHLFIISLAAHLLIKVVRINWCINLLAIVMLWVGVKFLNPQDDLPWSLDLLPITISFYLFGYSLRNIVKNVEFDAKSFVAGVIIFTLLHYFFNETMDLNLRLYGNIIIETIQAYTGIYLCLSLSALIARSSIPSRWLSYIGSGSLFVLIFHIYFQSKLFHPFLRIGGSEFLAIVASWIAGLIIPLIIFELVKRNKYLSIAFLPINIKLAMQ